MLRPSMSRGLPAFGCADSRALVTAASRSIVSSIGAGPTLQLTPTTSAPRSSEHRRELLGRRAVEAVAILLGRHLRDDGQVADAADGGDRRADLVEVAERLEDEQVDAALEQRLGLLREHTAPLRRRRSCPTARRGRRADRSRRPRTCPVAGHARARAARRRRLMASHPLAQAERAQLDPIGAERVGLDDVGAGAQVFRMHAARPGRLASGSATRSSG